MTSTRARRTISRTMARAGGVALVAAFLAGFGLAPSGAEAKPAAKVAICHATSSTSNPYIKIVVKTSSLDGQGKNDHTGHGGGLFDFSDPAGNGDWGDIIPSGEGVAFSMNATLDGLGVLGNGCNGPDEGSCPDGSDPVGGDCPTEETCPNGEAATGGECDEDDEVVLCETDAELLADDPLCGVEGTGDGEDDVVLCETDAELLADDPLCGVEGTGDGEDDVVPCETDAELLAVDPACGVEDTGDGEDVVVPCESDPELLADDPLCGVEETGDGDIDEVVPCETDPELSADDPACGAGEEQVIERDTTVDEGGEDGGDTPDETQPTVDPDSGLDSDKGVEVLPAVVHPTRRAVPTTLPVTGAESLALAVAGVVLIALGVAFALWARLSRA